MPFERPTNMNDVGKLFTPNVLVKWHSMDADDWLVSEHLPSFSLPSLLSGATSVGPTGESLGGVNLDANTEYIYLNISLNRNWDYHPGISIDTRPYFDITFETDVDNRNGAAASFCEFQIDVHMKALRDHRQRYQRIVRRVVIGPARRYTMFDLNFFLDVIGSDAVRSGDEIAMRLSYHATESTISDVIVNQLHWHYHTHDVNLSEKEHELG